MFSVEKDILFWLKKVGTFKMRSNLKNRRKVTLQSLTKVKIMKSENPMIHNEHYLKFDDAIYGSGVKDGVFTAPLGNSYIQYVKNNAKLLKPLQNNKNKSHYSQC